MRRLRAGLCLAASLALAGCATSFHGSAPADTGDVYFVGGKVRAFQGWQPAVWRCPQLGGECQEVEVSR